MAVPADRNVVQKEVEKKLKYKSLGIEIERMWNLKCTIVPVIIGATGIVTRSLKKNLQAIPGTHSIDSLQKTAILGISHILRKVLQCETLNLSDGVHRWFKKHTRKKGPVTSDNNNNNNLYAEICTIHYIRLLWLFVLRSNLVPQCLHISKPFTHSAYVICT